MLNTLVALLPLAAMGMGSGLVTRRGSARTVPSLSRTPTRRSILHTATAATVATVATAATAAADASAPLLPRAAAASPRPTEPAAAARLLSLCETRRPSQWAEVHSLSFVHPDNHFSHMSRTLFPISQNSILFLAPTRFCHAPENTCIAVFPPFFSRAVFPPRHPFLPHVAHPFSPYLRIQLFIISRNDPRLTL